MELTINGQVYKFNFGMGFLREINKIPHGNNGTNAGFKRALSGIYEGSAIVLVDVLCAANIGQEPRISRKELDNYLDNECEDIEEVFETVMGFFEKSNSTKVETKRLLEQAKKIMNAMSAQ